MLAAIKPVISAADLAICHIEAPFAAARGPFEGFPTFSMPPQVVSALTAIGYDECSTASNHSMDQGSRGLTRTLAALDADHIGHAGTAATPAAASRPQILDVHGIRVGHLSYTYGLNGGTPPPDGTWMVNVIDDGRAIVSAAHELRRRGADVVILSLHWGIEYQHVPTPKQRAIAKQLLASPDIDLIIGHHAHVVQPFERIRGKWVVYGLGNLIARHQRPRGVSEEGIIARFTFDKADGHWRVTTAEWVPILVDLGPPIRLVELPQALKKQDLDPAKRARYQAAVARTRAIVESRGAASDGLSMGG
jgi:poly-gamma-glutamate synthesis protein (capsule biosynthesis protein)